MGCAFAGKVLVRYDSHSERCRDLGYLPPCAGDLCELLEKLASQYLAMISVCLNRAPDLILVHSAQDEQVCLARSLGELCRALLFEGMVALA